MEGLSRLHFFNPSGAWFLIGVPILIAIHFLQDKVRDQWISALFLWEMPRPQSIQGKLWRQFRSSPVFWIQLLIVLWVTWIVCDPRWITPSPMQRILVLVDGSASMSVCSKEAEQELDRLIREVSVRSRKTEWKFLRTDTGEALVLEKVENPTADFILKSWKPRAKNHSFETSIEAGLEWVRGGGALYVLTDHKPSFPDRRVGWRLVGHPIDNVGWVGLTLEQVSEGMKWRAFVRNFSTQRQIRKCQWQGSKEIRSLPAISLEPGAMAEIQGIFPPDESRGFLELEPDRFSEDDRMPVQKPLRETFHAQFEENLIGRDFFEKWAGACEGIGKSPASKHPLFLKNFLPGNPLTTMEGAEIMVYSRQGSSHQLDLDPILADQHSLVRDLEWKGLMTGGPGYSELASGDEPLLWQGNKPLIFLKKKTKGYALFLNFEWENSNARRYPSFVVLLNRYARWMQDQLFMEHGENFISGNPVRTKIKYDESGLSLQYGVLEGLNADSWKPMRWNGFAPETPGFFEVRGKQGIDYQGASRFEDPVESNFQLQETAVIASETDLQWMERSAERTGSRPWMTLFILGLLLGTWLLQRRSVE